MTHLRQRTQDETEIKLSRDVIFFAVGMLVGAMFMVGVLCP